VQREQHRLAHHGGDAVLVLVLHEELPQPRGRDVFHDALRVGALARGGDGALVDVGREDLDLQRLGLQVNLLAQQHAQRIGFLARGAARDPDAHLLARLLGFDDARNRLTLQCVEGIAVAKEVGHADEHVLQQQRCLCRDVRAGSFGTPAGRSAG
jgi:hypothetical protein